MTRASVFALVFVAACFNPTFHNPTCGPNGECPSGTTCVDGTCRGAGSMDDAGLDGASDDSQLADASPDGLPQTCNGAGAWQMCVATGALTATATLPSTINTDTSSLCTTAVTWTSAAQPDSCVIAGTTVSISSNVTVTGDRPLVLFATGDIVQISGAILDVASHRLGTTGPGKAPTVCMLGTVPTDSTAGAGGGAGGSFINKAGNGGPGGNGAAAGVAANADTAAPTVLRGGCRGQQGGTGENNAGSFGQGGGAVYLAAANTISLAGSINASGSAGGTGDKASGGGGGGAGGMIVFFATSVMSNSAKFMANGGGGGGGGGGTPGQPGFEPNLTNPTAVALGGNGGSGNNCAGTADGGAGAAGTTPAVDGTAGVLASNCGGGGGGGAIGYIRSNVALVGVVTSSPAVSVVP